MVAAAEEVDARLALGAFERERVAGAFDGHVTGLLGRRPHHLGLASEPDRL